MERVKLLGAGIDTYSYDEALEFAKANSGQVITINPEMLEYAQKHSEFLNIIKNAELVIPDGIGVQLGLKIMGYDIKRIPGIEFAKELLKEFQGRPVALIGTRPEILSKAVQNLKKELPDLNLVYVQDGYFTDTEKILNEAVAKKPALILAALGSPKQEEFLYRMKKMLPNALMIGVGGSFDVWSGVVERAPKIYQRLGLEWLYRTVKEPKRFKRIFPALPLFVLKVLKEKWS